MPEFDSIGAVLIGSIRSVAYIAYSRWHLRVNAQLIEGGISIWCDMPFEFAGKSLGYFIRASGSGIGAEFARQLAVEGYSLILVARREDRLVDLAREIASDYHVTCECITADLSELQECDALVQHLQTQTDTPIDVLINNAGFGAVGRFDKSDISNDLKMIDVNVKALHYIAHQMMPYFIARDHGHIINVGSVAGLMPGGPFMATYYATKSH